MPIDREPRGQYRVNILLGRENFRFVQDLARITNKSMEEFIREAVRIGVWYKRQFVEAERGGVPIEKTLRTIAVDEVKNMASFFEANEHGDSFASWISEAFDRYPSEIACNRCSRSYVKGGLCTQDSGGIQYEHETTEEPLRPWNK